jgi:hypothetical protein
LFFVVFCLSLDFFLYFVFCLLMNVNRGEAEGAGLAVFPRFNVLQGNCQVKIKTDFWDVSPEFLWDVNLAIGSRGKSVPLRSEGKSWMILAVHR